MQPNQEVRFHKLDLAQQLAHTLVTPWVAYFLFVAGFALIVFEFFTAGVGIAGFVGARRGRSAPASGSRTCPCSTWALGLLLLGLLGLSIDLQAGGLGAWTFIGGAVARRGIDHALRRLVAARSVVVGHRARVRWNRPVHALGHDRDDSLALLDTDDRTRGPRRRAGCRRGRHRTRRRRPDPRRVVAGPHEPGDADRLPVRRYAWSRWKASCSRSNRPRAAPRTTGTGAGATRSRTRRNPRTNGPEQGSCHPDGPTIRSAARIQGPRGGCRWLHSASRRRPGT